MGGIAFLLGAGFSLTANTYSDAEDPGHYSRYPLADGLAQECFGASYDLTAGVEAAFQMARDRRDRDPIEKLVKVIASADMGHGRPAATNPGSAVRRFIRQIPATVFLTFNYDCLVEQVLLQEFCWDPRDGFGLDVKASIYPLAQGAQVTRRPVTKVIHLHGSLYLYARRLDISPPDKTGTEWATPKGTSEFVFDPGVNGHLFNPFKKEAKVPRDLQYTRPTQRIIAPVPNKVEELSQQYVQEVYRAAQKVLRTIDQLIVIGYRFGETDRASYAPLLEQLNPKAEIVVIAPDATLIAARLKNEFADLSVLPIARTFDEWVEQGFPLKYAAA